MISKLRVLLTVISSILFFAACQKEVSIENGQPGITSGTALFTLAGAPGNCASPVVNGAFEAGTPVDITSFITVDVNVDSIGTYLITSNSVNGISFVATGTFTTTGPQTIVFKSAGTPLIGGSFNFTLGTNGCSVVITVTGSVTPPVSNSNCKSCAYIPICVGSKYEYNDTMYGVPSIKKVEYLSTKDTTINGKVYQKISDLSGDAYYNCTNGETTAFSYSVTSVGGNTVQNIKLTPLKADAPIGTTWTDPVINPLGQTVLQKFTIVSKGSRTAGGFNFPDVIKVKLETGMDLPPVGFITAALSYSYYAKGVGLIENTIEDPNTNDVVYRSVIKTYFIP